MAGMLAVRIYKRSILWVGKPNCYFTVIIHIHIYQGIANNSIEYMFAILFLSVSCCWFAWPCSSSGHSLSPLSSFSFSSPGVQDTSILTYYYCSYFHLTLLFHEHKKNPWGLSVFVLAGFLLSILYIQIKNAHKEQLAESKLLEVCSLLLN